MVLPTSTLVAGGFNVAVIRALSLHSTIEKVDKAEFAAFLSGTTMMGTKPSMSSISLVCRSTMLLPTHHYQINHR
ncbi:hypothetical protein BDQ94DRAFT_136093 [Aspergillus welwitschiae]|uniref:Uncharacterized protein n=1 Tax=Aspergillus welwitschiae TaxID=1341132 RepID=A0A3F3QE05_9EURO|nr:hypothetical protein BDQ94DRAFT_136093 [Aspergillus welwitschiae]RDH37289.1 hypothetical protein BDQ94DRAFT_136093 [Aspergillus welwitschiae]